MLFMKTASSQGNANNSMSELSTEFIKQQNKWDHCFTTPNQSTTSQTEMCFSSSHGSISSIFVWGDSRAASFGSGMSSVSNDVYFITYTSCPPVISNAVGEDCKAANIEILRVIEGFHPKFLVPTADWRSLEDIVVELTKSMKIVTQELSNTRIVVLGPLPHGSPSLR